MSDKKKKINVTVLGKVIGTASLWDQVENFVIIFQDFEPNELGQEFIRGKTYKYSDLLINLENGIVKKLYNGIATTVQNPNWSVFNEDYGTPLNQIKGTTGWWLTYKRSTDTTKEYRVFLGRVFGDTEQKVRKALKKHRPDITIVSLSEL